MTAALVMLLMLGLLAIGMPIFVSMGIASLVGFAIQGTGFTSFITTAFSGLDSFPLMAVPFFILAGKLMEFGGISERLVNLINFFIGKIYGAMAVVGVVTCAFFGAVSGSAVATSVSVGGIVMPTMEEEGYDKAFSAGLMGVAGTIGALIPPSMTFIIYGSLTNTSVGDLFKAGIIPGVLVTVVLSAIAHHICKKRGYIGERNVDHSLKNLWTVFRKSIGALFVPVIILGGIYGGIFTPTEAGAVACIYAAIISCFFYKTLDFKGLVNTIIEAGRLCIVTMIIIAFASGLAKYLTMENVPQQISDFLMGVASSKISFLLIVTIFLLFVGCIMDTTPAMIVLAPIFQPIALQYGVDPIQFGMIMSLALLVGLATPPVGSNLFVMASVANLPFMKVAKAMVPFICGTLFVLVLIIFFPILSTLLI